MIRSIAAVLVGLIVTFLLVMLSTQLAVALSGIPMEGRPSRAYLTLNIIGSAIAGMAGGATAVRIAAHAPHGHVIALAIAILLLSLPTLLAAPAPGQPSWYPLLMSALGPVSVLVGGLLAGRRWRSRYEGGMT